MSFFYKNLKEDFFEGFEGNLRPKQYTVVVQYMSGYQKEYPCIEAPWQYIAKVKKNPTVKNAWIK